MRCEWSDLEEDQCAHCKKAAAPEVDEVDPLEGVRLADKHDDHEPRAFPAQYRSVCLSCGNDIEVGEFQIGRLRDPMSWSDGFKGYVHEECP